MKQKFWIFPFIFMILLAGCAQRFDRNPHQIVIDNGQNMVKIKVEIADDEAEKTRGLMLRERLKDDEGMLFVFDDEEYQTFWMKDTLIPLDMVFIGKNLRIVDIKSAVPCKSDPCILYKSLKPAMYVLEVNGNLTIRDKIKVGNKVSMKSKIADNVLFE